MSEIIVQKFGGTSVATPEKIKSVAQFIHQRLQNEQRILVVVSAMGQATNDLIALAHEVSKNPPKREMDMLMSCGERTSMALLAMALCDLGIKAMSLTGSQSGIITDDQHSNAEITAIMPNRVIEALENNQVVIIAGFQGVSFKKEITTLRRGGSDTTAVAMAWALKARVCEIYTDVDGIFDADPRLVKRAQILPEVNCGDLTSMALYGAKVMAHDAASLAHEFGVKLLVAKVGKDSGSIAHNSIRSDKKPITAMTHLRGVVKYTFENAADLKNDRGYFLCGYKSGPKITGYSSNDIAQELIDVKTSELKQGLALITLHLAKNQFALATYSKIESLKKEIAIEDMIIGGKEIFVIIKDQDLNIALNLFYSTLMMDV